MVQPQDRYRFLPSLEVYDSLEPVLAPYLTFISRPDFHSSIVNTDRHGFRVSADSEGELDSTNWWSRSLRGVVLGGSFVFGVGASTDQAHLVSCLNRATGRSFLNLGIRAGNSFQEFIAVVPFLERCHDIVVCSGLNNLVVHLQTEGGYDLYGPFFCEDRYRPIAQRTIWQVSSVVELHARGLGPSDLWRAAWRRMRVRWNAQRQNGEHSPVPSDGGARSHEERRERLARAVDMQVRDLTLLARAKPKGASLCFVAQPFAGGLRKVLTEEERNLFEVTDGLQGPAWQLLKSELVELWAEYVGRLESACENLGIRFLDLNSVVFDGWCFVDRAHMTDRGYEQAAGAVAALVA